MHNKVLAVLAQWVAAVSLVACGGGDPEVAATAQSSQAQRTDSLSMAKALGASVADATPSDLVNQAVKLQDAIAILKMIVGLDVNAGGQPVTPYQLFAADFDGNGKVELADAIGVLKRVVGLDLTSPKWLFFNTASSASVITDKLNPGPPPELSAYIVSSAAAQVGLVAVLRGDVVGSTLNYSWSLGAKPAGSKAVLASATAATPTFTADIAGDYVATLRVTDGSSKSAMATMTLTAGAPKVLAAEIFGYLEVAQNPIPESYNAGYSIYAAAWPLLSNYPGNSFNSGLFGTWMWAIYPEGNPANLGSPTGLYSDIEGGLGWWNDTRFATETPKFIMGGVNYNFNEWANGPGSGKGRDWTEPNAGGKYGVAQLSPWLLWPPDGLNLKQGTNGELLGYGYLPLPLTNSKITTAGKNVPTGDNSWTLFLNARNFKGPVAFFTPYFWSRASVAKPELSGLFLDSRSSDPNKQFAAETHLIPSFLSTDAKGETYARTAPISFPRDANGDAPVLHRPIAYNKSALWDSVKAWFAGGAAASGVIDIRGASEMTYSNAGSSSWTISVAGTADKDKPRISWSSFATPVAINASTYGYRWNQKLVSTNNYDTSASTTLPQYFRSIKNSKGIAEWMVVQASDVPVETGLTILEFKRAAITTTSPYTTPTDPQSSWKKPGPSAGPFSAVLGDGSTVTYYWYRFADQPALLNADLTSQEREEMQLRAVKLHQAWTKDREYLPAPTIGKLADIDPALIVAPPSGFEIGYVPIATRQERLK